MANTFRTTVVWMGKTVETLADIPCQPGGVLVIGINPARTSVAAGHYYQGRFGKRLWERLRRVGLLPDALAGGEDEAFARAGHGLTDLVKRPTASADEVRREEETIGLSTVRYQVRIWKPGLILFPFKRSARVLLGTSAIGPGQGPPFDGVPTFLLSGPYSARSEASRIDTELCSLLGLSSSPIKVNLVPPQTKTSVPSPSSSSAHLVAKGLDVERSQRITANDLAKGQIRFPHETKRFFSASRDYVTVKLRGEEVEGRYDPRNGPDKERSGLLRVGRSVLASVVKEDEVLRVSKRANGAVQLD